MSNDLQSLRTAFAVFADATQTQSQKHIKPLHQHIAASLVIEGGSPPEEIMPRPPLRFETTGSGRNRQHVLIHDPDAARPGEQTLLGGLKTKQVDVVVSKAGIGPCLAVSVKGMLGAFRNLTNRMEEAAGDCTNLHITYPALVYGFLHVLRTSYESDGVRGNDVAIRSSGAIAPDIVRYHDAMVGLMDRQGVRNDVGRYESVALALVDTKKNRHGEVIDKFPPADSPLVIARFFSRLYEIYDIRFVYAAPALEKQTRRFVWAPDSPALELAREAEFTPRLGADA